jgi:hypothetical protein
VKNSVQNKDPDTGEILRRIQGIESRGRSQTVLSYLILATTLFGSLWIYFTYEHRLHELDLELTSAEVSHKTVPSTAAVLEPTVRMVGRADQKGVATYIASVEITIRNTGYSRITLDNCSFTVWLGTLGSIPDTNSVVELENNPNESGVIDWGRPVLVRTNLIASAIYPAGEASTAMAFRFKAKPSQELGIGLSYNATSGREVSTPGYWRHTMLPERP